MATWLRKTLKILGYAFLVFVVFCAYMLYYYPLTGGWYVFKELDAPEGRFVVAGGSGGPYEGWGMRLFWKRPNEYWACYYLAHDEPYWTNVKLYEKDGHVVVENGGQLISDLDTHSLINFVSYGKNSSKPTEVYTGDPFSSDGGQEIDRDSPQWASAWPHVQK